LLGRSKSWAKREKLKNDFNSLIVDSSFDVETITLVLPRFLHLRQLPERLERERLDLFLGQP
jgi:hypothetical protein